MSSAAVISPIIVVPSILDRPIRELFVTSQPRLIIDGRRLTPHRTGVGRYLERLLDSWAETQLPCSQTVVVLNDPGGLARVPSVPGLQARLEAPRTPGLIWEHLGLKRVLRRGDVLFAPANLIPWGWRGPTVLVVHDLLMESRPEDFSRSVRWRFRSRYRRSARLADCILVPSLATADDLSRFLAIPASRIRVIPPSRDPAFRPMDGACREVREARARVAGLGDSPFFLFVGKRSRRRHPLEILQAFRQVRRSLPGHRLVFAGPADKLLAGSLDGVIVADHVEEECLTGLMATAEALLYPSESEGFGLPIVEAMAAGCPVITLRRPALLEAGGDAPIYLNEATPETLAAVMIQVATDRAVRDERVARGLARSSQVGLDHFGASVAEEISRFF